jgi:hypothetical protein
VGKGSRVDCGSGDYSLERSFLFSHAEIEHEMQVSLVLKRASASRPSGEWSDDDYDVLADGVVGRIFKPEVLPGLPWMWTLIFPYHEDRSPTHGYAATREDAMLPLRRVGGGSDPHLPGFAHGCGRCVRRP